MKQFKPFIFITLVAISFSSCSGDDDSTTVDFTGNYFPLTIDNSWTYDVVSENTTTNETLETSDFLFVDSVSANGFQLAVNTNNVANGTKNGILISGYLVEGDNKLALSNGLLSLPIQGLEDFIIPINGLVLYNVEVANNSPLSLFSGTLSNTLQGVDIVVAFSLSTTKILNSASANLNGDSYSFITSTNLTLQLEVSAVVEVQGQPTSFSILDEQDVLSINSFFVKDIGLVRSEAQTTYEINEVTAALLEALGIDLGITENTITNTQELNATFLQ